LLTSKSLFTSGAERRTPWECFERWIHLEGLPADMQKTHYFRAYTNRIEQANRLVMAQAAQAQAQPNANGQVQPPPRRRPTTSFRVERRRNQKHLTLVDAMRKLAKKRETSLQKQQHAAGMAAMRKANEAAPNPAVANHNLARTPQAFSRMRQEQDEKMRERMIHLQQRQEQQRRVFLSNLHHLLPHN
jgi:chromatin modification-related protein VID21